VMCATPALARAGHLGCILPCIVPSHAHTKA
jgi:hypothetical protein